MRRRPHTTIATAALLALGPHRRRAGADTGRPTRARGAAGAIGPLSAAHRPARQGRGVGADAARSSSRRCSIWAKVTKDDFVMDLGSGDGRTVITGEARRARPGRRVQPEHGRAVEEERGKGRRERSRAVREGRPLRDRFLEGHGDHHVPAARHQPEAAPEDPQPEARHAHRLQYLHHGRLESRRDPPTWAPGNHCNESWCTALLWIVPAKVAGSWRMENGTGTLALTQLHQVLYGSLTVGSTEAPISKARVRGYEHRVHDRRSGLQRARSTAAACRER